VKCVILQPSYIPWRGYFDLVRWADVFVFYDDVQYDKHGWRNRNRIKTAAGTQWLTIPVLAKGNVRHGDAEGLLLRDVRVAPATSWTRKHAATLRQSYAKAPFFAEQWPLVSSFYEQRPERLCDFTIETTIALSKALGISTTRFVRSSELGVTGTRTERLVRILQHLGATHYLSGPSAKDYLDASLFDAAKVTLEYKTYAYPEYEQLHPPYDPQVTILDLLFMKGAEAPEWIWGARAR
jgi:WbqC-like protein family